MIDTLGFFPAFVGKLLKETLDESIIKFHNDFQDFLKGTMGGYLKRDGAVSECIYGRFSFFLGEISRGVSTRYSEGINQRISREICGGFSV